MSEQVIQTDKQVIIPDRLLYKINQALRDYQSYLESLPGEVRPLLTRMALVASNDTDQEDDQISRISPGKLSVLALPFWLGEAFGVDESVCRRISLANIFGLLHFMALDSLVDGECQSDQVPAVTIASTIYQQQLMAHYQAFFPPTSPFWSLMDKYWLEWAGSMVWERDKRDPGSHDVSSTPMEGTRFKKSSELDFSQEDLLRAARKAAPLKICTSGLALLGGHQDSIPILEESVDEMHMVMQMMDDLVDMGQDLPSDRYNNALNMVGDTHTKYESASIGESQPAIEAVGRHLFTTRKDDGYLMEMKRIAKRTQAALRELGLLAWADLIEITIQQAQKWRDDHVNWIIPPELRYVNENKETLNGTHPEP